MKQDNIEYKECKLCGREFYGKKHENICAFCILKQDKNKLNEEGK